MSNKKRNLSPNAVAEVRDACGVTAQEAGKALSANGWIVDNAIESLKPKKTKKTEKEVDNSDSE